MGDIADMMIEGFLDYETGELLDGDAPGYPRTKRHLTKAEQRKRLTVYKCPECSKRVAVVQWLDAITAAKKAKGARGAKP